MSHLPPARDGNPLDEPDHPYAVGPPPPKRGINHRPSPHRQVHKVYGHDKNHWFVECVEGRVPKDHPSTAPMERDALVLPLPSDTECCRGCFSTRERILLRRSRRDDIEATSA